MRVTIKPSLLAHDKGAAEDRVNSFKALLFRVIDLPESCLSDHWNIFRVGCTTTNHPPTPNEEHDWEGIYFLNLGKCVHSHRCIDVHELIVGGLTTTNVDATVDTLRASIHPVGLSLG